jgi:transcriptional regulator with XRE-family HTH domain
MMRTHRGTEVGRRTQAAIKRWIDSGPGRSRTQAAEAAGIEQSRLAKFCHGKLPLEEDLLEKLANVIGVTLSDLTGLDYPNQNGRTNGMQPNSDTLRSPPDRLSASLEAFIGGHQHELSQREVEWLKRVHVCVDNDPEFTAEGDRFWFSVLDLYRAREIRRRGGAS